ncbi:hypothetical protein [Catellatospora chokoriensis]|uniref:hypothetical protein n=1 Tax=Catellatospora chokoriensis TaxID=310353 RepID=UPI00178634AF|nr:hypothetical protein [Catellatospora chokoriensis]
MPRWRRLAAARSVTGWCPRWEEARCERSCTELVVADRAGRPGGAPQGAQLSPSEDLLGPV